MFPLVFAIEASALSLYPDPTATNVLGEAIVMPVVSGASIINSKNSFHYERTLTYDEYKKLDTDEVVDNESGSTDPMTMKVVPSCFLTNKAQSDSYVYVYNEYFGLDSDSFTTQTMKLFTNLAFPDGVQAQADAATTFTFNAEEANTTVTVKLQGLYRLVNDEKIYEFTVDSGTNKAVSITDLKTERASGTVRVSLSADGYAHASLSAVQANEVVIPAGNISFSNLNLGTFASSRTISVYSDSNYSNQITSFTLSSDPGTNPELNLGEVSDDQRIYFRYAIQFMGTTYYTVSATVDELTSTAGLNLKFDN
jgi:hypothetical protein